MSVSLLLLGPVDLRDGEVSVALGGPKQRSVLAMLTLAGGRVVSVDRLIDGLWDEDPPSTAANNVQVHVAALRKILGTVGLKDCLVTRAPGYLIRPDLLDSDVAQFSALRRAAMDARAEGDLVAASRHFAAGLALWRGDALADLLSEPFAASQASAMNEERLATVETFLETQLRLGQHQDVALVTAELLREHPTREAFWAHHLLALYRSGRQADALEAYQRARDTLNDGLGIEPGPELVDLQRRILRHDPELSPASPLQQAGAAVDLSVCVSTMLRSDAVSSSARLVTGTGDVIALDGKEMTIGRQPSCDLRLTDPGISRYHARISRVASGHVVEDLGSTNGSKVNGVPLLKTRLSNGDCLELGGVIFRYEVVNTTSTPAPDRVGRTSPN